MSTAPIIDNKTLSSRLFLGTARYPSPDALKQAAKASNPGLITVSLRRENAAGKGQKFWSMVKDLEIPVLPNTAGCHSTAEAITTAEMAREIFETNWIKLEIIENDYSLAPSPSGLRDATEKLANKGFKVFPYMTEDITLARDLVNMGCDILMPWGAPIGTGRGLADPKALKLLRDAFPDTFLVIDAGIGAPSHAAFAMELGYDAVLMNTAIAKAENPVTMAKAMSEAIKAGREGYLSGIITPQETAAASTPEIDKPFWHQV